MPVVVLAASVPFSSLAAPLFGAALVALGIAFLRRHRRTWLSRKNDPAVDYAERMFCYRQYRRRMLTSGLLVLLGVLIPIGTLLVDHKQARAAALPITLYWIGVLLLVLWVLLLGIVDLFATGFHAQDAMSRVRAEKAALERQVEEIRKSLRENGR